MIIFLSNWDSRPQYRVDNGEDEEEERQELQEEVEEADQTGAEPGRVLGD